MKDMKLITAIAGALFVALWTTQTASAWYDPSTGRWLTRDPIGEPGFELLRAATSDATVSPLLPSRWISRDPIQNSMPGAILAGEPNRYLFVHNNPIAYVDKDGLQIAVPFPPIAIPRPDPISCAFTGGAAVGAGLCWAFPNTMTKPGEWIGNLTCRRTKLCTYICVTQDGRAGIIKIAIPVNVPCRSEFTGPTGTQCKLINGNPGDN